MCIIRPLKQDSKSDFLNVSHRFILPKFAGKIQAEKGIFIKF
jgi:hypothetical protein